MPEMDYKSQGAGTQTNNNKKKPRLDSFAMKTVEVVVLFNGVRRFGFVASVNHPFILIRFH